MSPIRVAAPLAALLIASAAHAACEIDGCRDGDTCKLRCEETAHDIRLYCIDAPELSQKPWGQRARDALRAEVHGTIRTFIVGADRHDRVVAELIREDGRNLGLELVREGYAAVYPRYCDEPAYFIAEESARAAMRGIWSVQGAQQRPWEWRK